MTRKAAKSQAASSASAPPTETLGLVACGPQERPRVLGLGRLLRTRTGLGQRVVEFAPRLLPVALLGQAGLSGHGRNPLVRPGNETAARTGSASSLRISTRLPSASTPNTGE